MHDFFFWPAKGENFDSTVIIGLQIMLVQVAQACAFRDR